MTDKPTEAQQQWFWEQCGLTFSTENDGTVRSYDPDGNFLCFGYPDMGLIVALGLLFKYAVPKAIVRIMGMFHWEYEDLAYKHLFRLWYEELLHSSERPNSEMMVTYPALALFWAIYSVLGGK